MHTEERRFCFYRLFLKKFFGFIRVNNNDNAVDSRIICARLLRIGDISLNEFAVLGREFTVLIGNALVVGLDIVLGVCKLFESQCRDFAGAHIILLFELEYRDRYVAVKFIQVVEFAVDEEVILIFFVDEVELDDLVA